MRLLPNPSPTELFHLNKPSGCCYFFFYFYLFVFCLFPPGSVTNNHVPNLNVALVLRDLGASRLQVFWLDEAIP